MSSTQGQAGSTLHSKATQAGDNEPKFLAVSGSSWNKRHLNHFNIEGDDVAARFPAILMEFQRVCSLDKAIRHHLGSIPSSNFPRLDHRRLMMNTGKHLEKLETFGTVLGPFFTFLAMVKEMPYDELEDVSREPKPRRGPKPIHRPEYVNTDSVPDIGAYSSQESGDDDESYADDLSQKTDQSLHQLRAKPEITTQTMLILFLQAVFEGSDLHHRGISQPAQSIERWEWHISPTSFHIEAINVGCTSINDGSLHYKGYNDTGEWVIKHPLVYCSIETKARFHKWEEDGLLGSKDDHVHAQEASQLIGMMCQRIQYLRKKKYKAIDPKKLSAYDRTVFLVSGTQRSMILKYATFTPEYMQHYFGSLLRTDSDVSDAELAAKFKEMQISSDVSNSLPILRIEETLQYNLSDPIERVRAAELLLAMGVYHSRNGPLLKDWKTPPQS